MSYDLDKVISFGQKIGAEVAVIMNGELRNYYKKGNKDTKYCCLTYTNHNNGRPLRWESANEYHYERIIEFNRSMGYAVEVIEIPEHEKKPEP